jgi:hypothetical protein
VSDTTEAIAGRLTAALEEQDASALFHLLDPDVRWGPEEETPETCHNRAQAMAWFARLAAAGTTATVAGVEVDVDRIVLSLDVTEPVRGQQLRRSQYTVAGGRIVDIRPL